MYPPTFSTPPRVYIAAPFFNPVQVTIVQQIEDLLQLHKYDYYSPRLHSGSAGLTSAERKNYDAWTPIINSNVSELYKCDIVLAVLAYAQPDGWSLCVGQFQETEYAKHGAVPFKTYIKTEIKEVSKVLELPDNGVVWECGAAHILGKPIVGFHPTKPFKEMNLMLSHTIDGFISGFDILHCFLAGHHSLTEDPKYPDWTESNKFKGEVI